jgi:hypothetical protein
MRRVAEIIGVTLLLLAAMAPAEAAPGNVIELQGLWIIDGHGQDFSYTSNQDHTCYD